MQIRQKRLPYNPIEIVLEAKKEAMDLFSLVDKLDAVYSHAGVSTISITPSEYQLIRKLSDARTVGDITI